MIQIGKISVRELMKALKKGQPNKQFTRKNVQLFFSQFDQNNDNGLSFQEFQKLFLSLDQLL